VLHAHAPGAGDRLRTARTLLDLGRYREAAELVEQVLDAGTTSLAPVELADSCGLSARLLALRGDAARALVLAELAVGVAHRAEGGDLPRAVEDRDRARHTLGEQGARIPLPRDTDPAPHPAGPGEG
jgi:hypothetical protein